MFINILTVVSMGIMALLMINKAAFTRTRRMAALPLACVGVELLMFGVSATAAAPAVTALLLIARGVILACCAGALWQDAALARRKKARTEKPAARSAAPVAVLRPVERNAAPRRSVSAPSRCA